MTVTSHTSCMTVEERHTAAAMGSGDLPVLATPALVALMENAAMLAARSLLAPEQTTVGASISVKHLKPSPIGSTIEAVATLDSRDGKRLTFTITARQDGLAVGEATHTRYIVDAKRFLERC